MLAMAVRSALYVGAVVLLSTLLLLLLLLLPMLLLFLIESLFCGLLIEFSSDQLPGQAVNETLGVSPFQ